MKHLLITGLIVAGFACGKAEPTETAVVKVSSAICGECASTITNAVKKVNGVKTVAVNTDEKTATIEFVPAVAKLGDIENAIVMSGYSANDKPADAAAFEKLPDCCKKK
jgi:copper chaperone CopZ